MAIYDNGVLIQGTPKHAETKTIWREVGDRVLFIKDFSESFAIPISFA